MRLLRRILLFATVGAVVLASAPVHADQTRNFWLRTKSAGLNGEVIVRVDGDGAIDPKKVQLKLRGTKLDVEPAVQPVPECAVKMTDFTFPLKRTDSNGDLWRVLLGSPFKERERPVSVSVEISDVPLNYRPSDAGPKTADCNPPPKPAENPSSGQPNKPAEVATEPASQPTITLITYDEGAWVGIVLALLIVIATGVLCVTTAAIRDTKFPMLPSTEKPPFSLGRFQMAVWFCLILASFLFILAITRDLNSITQESFILLGISGVTGLGAVAIDQSKNGNVVQSLSEMGLNSLTDVTNLQAASAQNGTAPASTVIPGAKLPNQANPTVAQLWQAYQAAVSPYKASGNIIKDLVTDANGATIHRWQILAWTIVLGVIYLSRVYANLEVPSLGTNLLTLMGISGGVYLGFKIPEKQSS